MTTGLCFTQSATLSAWARRAPLVLQSSEWRLTTSTRVRTAGSATERRPAGPPLTSHSTRTQVGTRTASQWSSSFSHSCPAVPELWRGPRGGKTACVSCGLICFCRGDLPVSLRLREGQLRHPHGNLGPGRRWSGFTRQRQNQHQRGGGPAGTAHVRADPVLLFRIGGCPAGNGGWHRQGRH